MEKITFKKIAFLIVPLLSSLISTYHLYDFFVLGNPKFVSFVLALSFELGAIASFLYIEKIENNYNKTIFWVLFIMQIFGNIYFSYNYTTLKMIEDPKWLDSFRQMYEIFFNQGKDDNVIKIIVSLIMGLPIPIISLAFLNSYVNNIIVNKDEEQFIEESIKNYTENLDNKNQNIEKESIEQDEDSNSENSEEINTNTETNVENRDTFPQKVVLEQELESFPPKSRPKKGLITRIR